MPKPAPDNPALNQKQNNRILLISLHSFFSRVIVLIIGLLVALACLEGVLRAFAIKNTTHTSQHVFTDTVRVLCVGDSTTQGQYPNLLEKELKRIMPKRHFEVFDKGQAGVNSTFVVQNLKQNIKQLQPDIVVAMIGCNDTEELFLRYGHITSSKHMWFIQNIKVYALFYFLINQTMTKPKITPPANKNLPEPVELTPKQQKIIDNHNTSNAQNKIHQQQHFDKYKTLLYKDQFDKFFTADDFIYQYNKNNTITLTHIKALLEIIDSNFLQVDQQTDQVRLKKLENYLLTNIRTKETCKTASQMMLYRLYEITGQFKKMASASQTLWEQNPEHFDMLVETVCSSTLPENSKLPEKMRQLWLTHITEKAQNPADTKFASSIYFDLRLLDTAKLPFDIAAKKLEKALLVFPSEDNIYKFLINIYLKQKDFDSILALYAYYLKNNKQKQNSNLEDFWQQILLLHAPLENVVFHAFNSPLLRTNYRRIADICAQKKLPLFAMQYPIMEANTLRHILKNFENTKVVSNEHNFKPLVNAFGYAKYFVDNFGGCFGHATDEGNRLIAINMAQQIKLFLKKAKTAA